MRSRAAKVPALCQPFQGAPFCRLVLGVFANEFLDLCGDKRADGRPALRGDDLGFSDRLDRKLEGQILIGHAAE